MAPLRVASDLENRYNWCLLIVHHTGDVDAHGELAVGFAVSGHPMP